MSVAKRLGLLKASTSALFLCDMQVKFAPSIAYFPEIVKNSKRVLGAAQIFDLPVLATEQYPKGKYGIFTRPNIYIFVYLVDSQYKYLLSTSLSY